METVVIVIHLMVVVALVGVVLLQRSEGGALGMGGGGGGGLMSSRGTANALTKMTAILAAAFFVTSLVLAILARTGSDKPSSILDTVPVPAATAPGQAPAQAPTQGGILDVLQKSQTSSPPVAPSAPVVAPTETPKVETPKVEAPKVEAPAPTPAPVEAPKAETPAPAPAVPAPAPAAPADPAKPAP